MQRYGFPDEMQSFFTRFGDNGTTRQIRDVSAKAFFALFQNYQVSHRISRPFRTACFKILLSVPGGTSRLGLPATVTVPGLLECLNCRWLPFVRTSFHPSRSSSCITSRNFMYTPLCDHA